MGQDAGYESLLQPGKLSKTGVIQNLYLIIHLYLQQRQGLQDVGQSGILWSGS